MPIKNLKDLIARQDLFGPGHGLCAGCGAAQIARIVTKVIGKDSIIASATGCLEVSTTTYPWTAWKSPYIHVAFENAAAAASGVRVAYDALIMKKKLGKDVNVVVLAGDGGTADIGLQALSGAFERGDRITYICYDNEAYMNCLPASSLIMTENGIKRIVEIKHGEKVYTFDHKTKELALKACTSLFDNGIRPIFELRTLHHQIRATPNHPFLVLKRNGRGRENELVWKKLSEIKPGDMVVVLKKFDGEKSYKFNPIKKIVVGDYKVTHVNDIKLPEKTSPDLMKYFGIYVGDGWTRLEKGETGFALPEGTQERGELIKLHSNIFGDHIREDDMYVYINSINLSKFIRGLEFGEGARNKTIPDWIFLLPSEEKEAFVEGLLMSDGYRIGNSFRYVSASDELLTRLRLLLQTMGYRAGKIHRQKKEKGTICAGRKLLKDAEWGYVAFSKRKEKMVDKYLSQYKYHDFLIESKHFEMEKIREIKPIGEERVFDLHVKDEHNFIADGIVVHNTGIQRSGATPYSAWTTTSPAGQRTLKKDLMGIAIAHRVKYAATASISYLLDAVNKVEKAISMNGPSFIHWLQPCTIGWRYDPKLTVKLGRLAVKTGLWPLYEYYDGATKLTVQVPRRVPVSEYLKPQGRFRHIMDNSDELAKIQSLADGLAAKFGLGPVAE